MYASKNLIRPLYLLPMLLLVPLIAMQFTAEVDWSPFDFLVMGTLLLALGAAIEWAWRKFATRENRLAALFIIILVFFLIWAELAVGIFGTVFAGS